MIVSFKISHRTSVLILLGECQSTHADFMKSNCAPTCQMCHLLNREEPTCSVEENGSCVQRKEDRNYSEISRRVREKIFMIETDWGEPQEVGYSFLRDRTLEMINRMNDYMTNDVLVKAEFESVRTSCRNKHQLCSFWAAKGEPNEPGRTIYHNVVFFVLTHLLQHLAGECEKNPSYMLRDCAPSCQSCDRLLNDKREEQVAIDEVVNIEWGEPQILGPERERTLEVIEKMNSYMTEEVMVKAEYDSVRRLCKNKNKNCSKWAGEGKCRLQAAVQVSPAESEQRAYHPWLCGT